jgi:nicotinate-nucleotide adenylyltransferase
MEKGTSLESINFLYSIQNNHLYLQEHQGEVDFTFLGLGFKESESHQGESIAFWIKRLNKHQAQNLLLTEASRYPNSERFSLLQKMAPHFVYQPSNELIFFGGSFHPWHEGHKACLDLLKDRPCIILPDRNPFKEHREIDLIGTYSELNSKIDQTTHQINPEFILKTQKNPTNTWVQLTRKRFPDTQIALLMGMDSLMSIEKWFEAEELLSTLDRLYVASRMEGEEEQNQQQEKLKRFRNLEIRFLGHHPHEALSSTKLREQK